MNLAFTWDEAYGEELVAFVQKSVQTRSYSDEEGNYARLIEAKMKELGFPVARRTIAKYRDRLGIPVARLRR